MSGPNNITYYTLGFMFSQSLKQVVLIRKLRPAWQRDLFNGVGGKWEECDGGNSLACQVREFAEETGYKTRGSDWHHFALLHGTVLKDRPFYMDCYAARGDIDQCRTMTDEHVVIFNYRSIHQIHQLHYMMPNLKWLLPLARCKLETGQPFFSSVVHSGQIAKGSA